jgi:hypothetical protein
MITKGNSKNLGDPTYPSKKSEERLNNAVNRGGRPEVKLEVGLTHSRVNAKGNHSKNIERESLEGVNKHTECCKETSTSRRVRERTTTKLQHITRVTQDKPNYKFTTLAHLLNEEYLAHCFAELKRNKASGVDGISVEEYGKELRKNLQNLIVKMKSMSYRPHPVRRVYIPKENGKDRPIGIPSVEDKIVQMGISKILERRRVVMER